MGIAKIFGYAGLFAFGGIAIETKLTFAGLLGPLSGPSAIAGIPRSFGLVILSLAAYNFWIITYGAAVGSARIKYMDKAIKDGEKDAETRYQLPNLYVVGNTAPARAFNCVQRSHQQILESLSQFNTCALVSGLSFPITTAAMVSLSFAARVVWTKGYACSEGDPKKRYDHPLAMHIWTSLFALCGLSFASGVKFLAGDSLKFW